MAVKLTRAQVEEYAPIKWQEGPIAKPKDVNGVQVPDVLTVCFDKLEALNQEFPCLENAHTLDHIKAAIEWQNARTADREKRGVEGKAQA